MTNYLAKNMGRTFLIPGKVLSGLVDAGWRIETNIGIQLKIPQDMLKLQIGDSVTVMVGVIVTTIVPEETIQ